MSRTTRWSTPVLAIVGEILRTVTPNTLGSLVLVSNDTATTQTEIAPAIDRDQSTVSTYFQSLTIENADLSLVDRPNQCYSVTETGEEVIELVTDLSGIDLATIDWRSAAEKEQIGTLLAPLYKSRSVTPFFVLNSLRTRSGIAGLQGDPRAVEIDDVVRDVENRVQEMGETTSKKQIGQIVDRFATQDVVTVDDDRLTLIQKGKTNAELLHQLEGVIELLSHRDDRAAWIVSTFVVGDRNDELKAERKEDLCSCMDAASGADVPEAAVLD